MTSVIMKVEGMSCESTAQRNYKGGKALDGVSKVEVDLKSKTVEVEFDPAKLNADAIKAAIEDQGYDVLG